MRIAVLASLCVFSSTAGARAVSDDEAMEMSLERLLSVEVLSTEQYVRQLSGAASAASVVTAADIREFGYRNLADILRSLPGLYVTYDRNYSYVASRGFGKVGDWNSRVLILVDGVRANENIYDGAYIGNDFLVDVALIDRVEFIAGPAAAMVYGNNAFFGVVNVVTRRAQQVGGAEVAVGVGSAATKSARATFGNRLESGLGILLSASRLDSDGRDIVIPEFGGTAQGLDHERADRLYARIGFGEFSLAMAHGKRTKGDPNASYGQVFNDPRSRTIDEQTYIDASYEKSLGGGSAVSARLFYGRYDYQGDYVHDLAAAPPADLAVSRDEARGRWWGGEARYVGQVAEGNRLLVGADYQTNTARDQRVGDVGQPLLLDDHRHDANWAVFAHDEIAVGRALTVDIGGRYDRLASGDGEFHPRFGALYLWRPETVVKLLYGESFRTPNVFELYYNAQDGLNPNPDLRPERIKTLELAVEQRLAAGGRITANLFRNEMRGMIDYVPVAGPDGVLGTGDDESMFMNLVRVRTTGLEMAYERSLSLGGKFNMSYTLQRTRDLDGRTIENSPRHLAKFNWRHALFRTGWRFGLESQYVGSRDNYAGHEVASSVLVNLGLTTTVLRDLELTLRIANLFDRDVADPAAYFHAPLDRIPQDGRTLSAVGTYRF
jgi:iron complex outermembrane receptor protein